MDDLFSLDSVRDFMLSRGGRVKNHDLVTHFKSYLNDPTRKVANRQTFKNFVNTLATVKLDESGEKVLVLKKKYREGSGASSDATKKPTRHEVHHEFTTPMPKPPPRKVHKGAARWEEGEDEETEQLGASSVPLRRGSKEHTITDVTALYEAAAAGADDISVQITGLPETESNTDPDTLELSGVPEAESSTDPTESLHHDGGFGGDSSTDPNEHIESRDIHDGTDHTESTPAEPDRVEIQITDALPGTTTSETSSERDSPFVSETVSLASEASSMRGESSLASETSSLRETSPEAQPSMMPPPPPPASSAMSPDEEESKIPNATPMSVKDRAKHLNKMASETDIHSSKAHKHERGEKRGEDDSSSVSSVPISMDAAEREWLVTSAAADYHPMAKILLQNPHLAKRKNFMNGSPLHWAAKHGKPEVIKLLCGTHYVDVNARSGYTALHLAAMHGHEEIIELLVHGYGADPNIRDHSGKKAKQYLPTYASTRAHQLLQARRLSAAPPAGGSNFRRVGSYSAKIQKSGFFGLGNRASVAMRDSWASSNASEGSDGMLSPSPAASPRASPSQSPLPSPVFGRRGSATKDNKAMLPPRAAPLRTRKSRRKRDVEIVIDDAFRDGAGSDPTSMSPTSAKSQFI